MTTEFEKLREQTLECNKCALCQGRHNVVFGVGNENARIMFVGEGPGEQEDLQGEPFVGKSGQLLDKYLSLVDLSRKDNIYIANIVKCRPPGNRNPEEGEARACLSYLDQQIELVKPKVLVLLGIKTHS